MDSDRVAPHNGSLVRLPPEPLHLSTKKERYSKTPCSKINKTLNYRSAPTCRRRSNIPNTAKSVAKENGNGSLELSTRYVSSISSTYFYQCFKSFGLIGSGSFGDVYEVQSLDDGRTYAIKRSREQFRTEKERLRFCQEAIKYQEIEPHPNIVRFFRSWEEDNFLYIQLEFCPVTLSSYIDSEQDVDEKFVWNLASDMCSALAHIHSHNLLHLDVKPENIFMTRDDVFKLGDLGLISDSIKTDSDIEHSCGDAKYLAPEMLKNVRTRKADVFSLGISLLEVAADLDLPGSGPLWHLLRTGELPQDKVKHLSANLRSLIKPMIDPNPTTRPSAFDLISREPLSTAIAKRRSSLRWIGVKSSLHDWRITCQWYIDLCVLGPVKSFLMHIPFLNRLSNWFFERIHNESLSSETPPRVKEARPLYEPISESTTPLDDRKIIRQNFMSTHNRQNIPTRVFRDSLFESPITKTSTPLAPTPADKHDESDDVSKSIVGTRLSFD